jgi:hypothetical protein
MTADGGMNPEIYWDEARIALGRVAELFRQEEADGEEVTLDQLRGVLNYELIPYPVRQTIEGLSAAERALVTRIFTTLGENHFYLENNLGIMGFY